jgi:hypothetical protein
VRELSLDVLTTHVRKTSAVLQPQQLQQLLPLLLQWLQSFGPENDFIVPATQSVSELVAAAMQFASLDTLQTCAPSIMLLVQWLLQPHLQERAILYAPKVFSQVLMKLGAAVDGRSIIVAMANRHVQSTLPDLLYASPARQHNRVAILLLASSSQRFEALFRFLIVDALQLQLVCVPRHHAQARHSIRHAVHQSRASRQRRPLRSQPHRGAGASHEKCKPYTPILDHVQTLHAYT